jgi:hypothetical protein
MSRVTPIDWTVEEGLQFVLSCGASAPESLDYSAQAAPVSPGLRPSSPVGEPGFPGPHPVDSSESH